MESLRPVLGGLSPADFLETYWQKKPLLIRNAAPDFEAPLSAEDVKALAGNEEAISRLIIERGGDYPWQVEHGPFDPEVFAGLPDSHWTLLVQEVEQHVPAVARLLDSFRFVPNWRIDDVMVSFAADQGGVGPHIDNYDVFLLQGEGRRKWQIDSRPVEGEEELVPDIDVSMLQAFTPDEEWVLEPGDMLYLPPRIAHNGIALGPCMTLSIGFRAPSHADLLGGFFGFAAEQMDPLRRYTDPDLKPQMHPGEIAPVALERVRKVVREAVSNDRLIDEWFGRFMTEPKRGTYPEPLDEEVDPSELATALRHGGRLRRNPAARMAFNWNPNGSATLFVSGEAIPVAAPVAGFVPLLTGTAPLDCGAMEKWLSQDEFAVLVASLVSDGILSLEA
jgi:50S ribosomal protein L16 3-hydroxylase